MATTAGGLRFGEERMNGGSENRREDKWDLGFWRNLEGGQDMGSGREMKNLGLENKAY